MVDVARDVPAQRAGESGDDDAPAGRAAGGPAHRLVRWLTVDRAALALVVIPALVAAIALVIEARPDYFPTADHALTELQVRDVGRHEVLVGLYSRADWNHPGPALFYLLAPVYRLSGRTSIGIDLGALVLNMAAIAGMALVARRRGGTPLMLCTLIGSLLLARTLGTGFLSDAWNNFVVVFPFALLVLLVWSMSCGETWALWASMGVASFLAQTHVGFVLLALALLGYGIVTLAVPILRSGDGERRRKLRRSTAIALPLAGLLWLPTFLDVVLNRPSNLRKVIRWFRVADEGTHTLAEGWWVTTGQFGLDPEWLIDKRPFQWGTAESPFIASAPLPLLLLVVAAAGFVLWRRRRHDASSEAADGWRLLLLFAFTLVVSIVAVARTVGAAFDYRLRWTWVAPMVAFVLVAWTAWREIAARWPRSERRVLVPLALTTLVALSAVHVATAARGVTPREPDSAAVADLLPDVIDAVDPDGGQVLVIDPYHAAGYYSRAIVLGLERAGFDARVSPERGVLFGQHRVVDDDRPVAARLVVVQEAGIDIIASNPDMQLVAEWEWPGARQMRRNARRKADYLADLEEGPGRPTDTEILGDLTRLETPITPNHAKADHVAVFLDRT